jgi:hypothetical protein
MLNFLSMGRNSKMEHQGEINMKYVDNWPEIQQRFAQWWEGRNAERPLMKVNAISKTPLEPLEDVPDPAEPEGLYLDVDSGIKRYRNYCRTHKFMAESFPNFSVDLGPGSMALYLGAEPEFAWDTLWYKECVHDWSAFGDLRFNLENKWWKKHQELIKKSVDAAGSDFLVNIPDIIENVDILASLRGPQNLIYDLIDEPELILKYINQVDNLYFQYYNAMYNRVKAEDGSCSFTSFQIWGPGRTAKVQCDFSALMSPDQFREFVQPSLRKQCRQLDHSLYHLDGPDAIKHVDALMEIEELDALQWTCGAGKPDGASENWYIIYDKVRKAGKSLWIQLYDGGANDWANGAEKLVKRYGKEGLYFIFPDMEEEDAAALIHRAEKNWK